METYSSTYSTFTRGRNKTKNSYGRSPDFSVGTAFPSQSRDSGKMWHLHPDEPGWELQLRGQLRILTEFPFNPEGLTTSWNQRCGKGKRSATKIDRLTQSYRQLTLLVAIFFGPLIG